MNQEPEVPKYWKGGKRNRPVKVIMRIADPSSIVGDPFTFQRGYETVEQACQGIEQMKKSDTWHLYEFELILSDARQTPETARKRVGQ